MLPRRHPRTIHFAKKLRQRQTSSEALLWKKLRDHRFHGIKFRRQYPFGRFIADFACPELKIVIEIDGGDHWMRKEKDRKRDEIMQNEGFIILRFNNRHIWKNMDCVLDVIRMAVEADRI